MSESASDLTTLREDLCVVWRLNELSSGAWEVSKPPANSMREAVPLHDQNSWQNRFVDLRYIYTYIITLEHLRFVGDYIA